MSFPLNLLAAASTADQVFKSMGDELDTSVNPNHIVLIVVGLIGLLVLISLFSRSRPIRHASSKNKSLNQPAKLHKQIIAAAHLNRRQLKQLRHVAKEEEIDDPFVLLLCPSIVRRHVNNRSASKIDI